MLKQANILVSGNVRKLRDLELILEETELNMWENLKMGRGMD
jgi:hypothetical protein